MMKYCRIVFLILILSLFSCSQKEKKPFGAEVIDYNKVEGVNKDGPVIETELVENVPPISDRTKFTEEGPVQLESQDNFEPTADYDETADFGGIPIVTKERKY